LYNTRLIFVSEITMEAFMGRLEYGNPYCKFGPCRTGISMGRSTIKVRESSFFLFHYCACAEHERRMLASVATILWT